MVILSPGIYEMDDLTKQIERDMRRLSRMAAIDVHLANLQALNRVATMCKKEIVSNVATAHQIPKKEVRRRVVNTRASPKRSSAKVKVYTGLIDARYIVPNLNTRYEKSLTARRNRAGSKGGRRRKPAYLKIAGKIRKKAFIARAAGSGSIMVFTRLGRRRLPIDKLRVNISERVNRISPAIVNRLMDTEYDKEFARQLGNKLDKY